MTQLNHMRDLGDLDLGYNGPESPSRLGFSVSGVRAQRLELGLTGST